MTKRKTTEKKAPSIREEVAAEYPDSDLLFMDEAEYDAAIIGVSEMCAGTNNNHRVIYDLDKVLQVSMNLGMTSEEAIEFFDYNQGGAYVGDSTPIYINLVKNNKLMTTDDNAGA